MANFQQIFKQLEKTLHFTYYQRNNVCFGYFSGYSAMAVFCNTNKGQKVRVSLSAEKDGASASSMISTLSNNMPKSCQLEFDRYTISIVLSLKGKAANLIADLTNALTQITNALATDGFQTCDEAGKTGTVALYQYQGGFHLLSDESAAAVSCSLQGEKQQLDNTVENFPLGIVGALGGCILGGIIVLIVAMLGYISAISSVAFGGLIVGGYMKFGKKLSLPSAFLCSGIGILGSIVVSRVSNAIDAHQVFVKYGIYDYSVSDLIFHFKEITDIYFESGAFTESSVKMILITSLVAVAASFGFLVNQKNQHNMTKISS